MNSRITATALASILALGAGIAPACADEVSELKAALQALQKRLDTLETKAKEVEDTNDRQTDQIAKVRSNVGSWVGNFTWKGDMRYRNETIDQEYVANRNRDRIRLRTGFVAKVNDTIKTEVQLATSEAAAVGAADPRSSNQTLTGENTRKGIYVDLAYVEWQPHADWKFIGGKMKYPWVRPAANGYFFDNDVNPEGLAVNFAHGGLFINGVYNILQERGPAAASLTTPRVANAESTLVGGQLGYKFTLNDSTKLTLATAYFSHNAIKGWNGAYNSAFNGNTTGATGCHTGIATCYAYGYQVWETFGELSTTMANRPLVAHVDYAKNSEAGNGLDTAYSLGLTYGKASDPGTWEVGYIWNHIEKDSLYGQYVDSDFGAGNTDAEGSVFKFGYAPARNWTLNATYFVNQTNIDKSFTVGTLTGFNRGYNRLQLDLNFKF
ncbi:MAG: hypothetical protein RLZZ393_1672 [Pseudomonadota bacterium]